jgi:hypothetical protein
VPFLILKTEPGDAAATQAPDEISNSFEPRTTGGFVMPGGGIAD